MATQGAPAQVTPLTLLLGEDEDAAVLWFQGELFGAVRELTAYLTGASDNFAIHVDFSAHPEIAEFAAGALNKTPAELVSDGYNLNSADINGKLAAADSPPVESLEVARAWFTTAGRTLSIDDLQSRIGDPGAAPTPDGSIDASAVGASALDTARSIIGPVSSRGLLIGAFGIVLIVFQIAILGGRQWWSRAVWDASALAAASFAIVFVANPVYSAVVSPLLSDALANTRTDLIASDNAATSLGLRALDQLETVVNQQFAAVATNALVVGIVALLLASAAVALHVYLDRRGAAPEATPEPITLDAAPDTAEERVAA